ncbi:MAG: hypothetical protein IT328_04550 [Caldilineaceae bacterium]|nr:hypothetical protein [Caldilineaceae bacterium]
MQIRRGVTRSVLLIGNLAIKFPSLRHGQRYFIYGMLGNVLESSHWKQCNHHNLAPVYHCGPFGLWLVMKRYRTILERSLTADELATLPFIGIDNNGANVAVEDGRLILVDYGNVGWYYIAEENRSESLATQAQEDTAPALPESVKIADLVYKITYVDNASEVDIHRRQSLWGQIDYWTRTIRVYKAERDHADVMQTVWHEVVHGICDKFHIDVSEGDLGSQEKPLDLLATAINLVLQDNPGLRNF